jgi:hypothetical protein
VFLQLREVRVASDEPPTMIAKSNLKMEDRSRVPSVYAIESAQETS